MQVEVLGWLRVLDGTDEVRFGGELERRVLATLAAGAGSVVTLDELVEALFGERPPANAERRVRHHMWRLRGRLGADVIATHAGAYALGPGVDVDWVEFERTVAAAESAPDLAAAGALWARALSSWRGRPLPELDDWAPARALRERLIERREATIDDLAAAHLRSRRPDAAVALLEPALDAGSLRERRWMLLMAALRREGRTAEALRAYQRARTELADAGLAPGAELQDLDRAIGADDDARVDAVVDRLLETQLGTRTGPTARAAAPTGPRAHVPRAVTSWFGDTDHLRELAAEVAATPLVTLVGPGGVGKTRTAMELTAQLVDAFPDGTWFVDLAPLDDPESMVAALASACGVGPLPGSTAGESLLDWIRGRRLLVVLDNCEHVLDAAAGLAADIATACAPAAVLATSRERLGVRGERVVPVDPLPLPTARRLFLDRARRSGATDVDDDVAAIDEICRRLDGLPLAVELAAARTRTVTPAEMAARLDDELRSPRALARGGPARHRSLWANVAWSYELLDAADRDVFDRLGVLVGSFAVDGAAALAPDLDRDEVRDAIVRLAESSMVSVERAGGGARYRLLETLRSFALARLDARGDATEIRRRHLAHFVEAATSHHARWLGPDRPAADQAFDDDWDNLRAAHRWAVRTRDVDAATRLIAAVDAHAQGRMRTEVGEWAGATLDVAGGEDPITELCGRCAHWLMYAADHAGVLDVTSRGVDAAPSSTDPSTTLCWAFQLVSRLASGRLDGIDAAVTTLPIAAAGASDPFARGWAWSALCLASPVLGPDAAETWIGTYERDVEATDSSFMRMGAAYFRAMHDLFGEQPPRVEHAAELAGAGLLEARRSGDRQLAGQFMLLAIIVELVGGRTPDVGAVRETLAELHDVRNWMMTWLCLECASTTLALRGDVTGAATLDAFLAAAGLTWQGNPGWSELRDDVRRRTGVAATRSAGESAPPTTPADVIAFALRRLEAAAER